MPAQEREWVCLMYHDVSPSAPGVSGQSEYFAVGLEGFNRQLSSIADMGLNGCTIADALAPGGAPRVAISFDDGDLGQATRAYPALVTHGMAATFFITTGWVGRPGYVEWSQLRDMRDAGMSIQSHTHSHPFLSELDAAALREELHRSRTMLDEQLQQHTTMLALPGGDAPRRDLRRLMADEGYTVVGTSRWGVNNEAAPTGIRYVKRCTVRGEPSDETFHAIVSGNRWMSAKKHLREGTLAFIRSSLGPTRYARWRKRALNAAGGETSAPTDARAGDTGA